MFPISFYIGLILIGIFAGFASGLLGVGGGFLMVPLQFFLFSSVGVDPSLGVLGNQFGNYHSNSILWSLSASEKEQINRKTSYQISCFWNYWRILRWPSCKCCSFKNLADYLCMPTLYCSVGYAIWLSN